MKGFLSVFFLNEIGSGATPPGTLPQSLIPANRQRHDDPRLGFVSILVPPLEQPLAPWPRQAPKGVRALLLKRFRNGLHDGRAHVCRNMRYCNFQPVRRSSSVRCLSARSRRSVVKRTMLDGSAIARQTVRFQSVSTDEFAGAMDQHHQTEEKEKGDPGSADRRCAAGRLWLAPCAGFVTLRQTFVRCCHVTWAKVIKAGSATARHRAAGAFTAVVISPLPNGGCPQVP